jgi:Tfp pilus assembly protein PilV
MVSGFTILETLIGVVILTVSIGALAAVTARQWSRSSEVDVLDRVENAVARDLGWLKSYAKYWRMSTGPYNLSAAQTCPGASCEFVFSNTTTDYQPDGARCATATGLADDFVTAAGSVTITPARPHSIAAGDTTLNVAGLPNGTSLTRTITTGKNLVFLSYSFTGTNAAGYNFVREVALKPEAAAWCP